jgi:hypothetical protein
VTLRPRAKSADAGAGCLLVPAVRIEAGDEEPEQEDGLADRVGSQVVGVPPSSA